MVHGYLLRGTGSNIYVENVAKTWRQLGLAVTVVCQDRKAFELDFVDEFVSGTKLIPDTPPAPGTLRVVVPDINNLLPVYIYDEYEGYTVKVIPEMSEEEIETHIELTSEALKKILIQHVDLFFANHAMLSPVIVKRALEGSNIPYKIKIHGSAMEFVAAKYPEFKKYAYEGFENAREIIAGTTHIKKRILEVFSEKANLVEEKIKIVPPGMDENLFKPTKKPQENEKKFLTLLKKEIKENPDGRGEIETPDVTKLSDEEAHKKLVELGKTYNQRSVDSNLIEKWRPWNPEEPIIIYFGKFLQTKGVGELMLLTPKIFELVPNVRFVFVGFGTYREHLEAIFTALKTGNIELAKKAAKAGGFAIHINVEEYFRKLTEVEVNKITITGILNHELLSELLPLASISLMPSTFPEAFGMVAVESMSAGVFPVTNYHSGMLDVTDKLVESLPEIEKLVCKNADTFFKELPSKIVQILNYLYPNGFKDHSKKTEVGNKLRKFAVRNYSWENIGRKLLE